MTSAPSSNKFFFRCERCAETTRDDYGDNDDDDENIVDKAVNAYETLYPFNRFLAEAIS